MTKILSLSKEPEKILCSIKQMFEKATAHIIKTPYEQGIIILKDENGVMKFYANGQDTYEMNLLIDEFKAHLLRDEFNPNK